VLGVAPCDVLCGGVWHGTCRAVCHALITTAATTFAAAAAVGAVDIMHHCHHLPLSLSIIATIHVTVDHLHHPSLPPPIISCVAAMPTPCVLL
jgi:hypothetical protein